MKQIEELVCLEALLDFGKVKVTVFLLTRSRFLLRHRLDSVLLPITDYFLLHPQLVPLVVSGRFLVHHGPMRQLTVRGTYNSRTSFISIYLHLFNDILIISSKKYSTSLRCCSFIESKS